MKWKWKTKTKASVQDQDQDFASQDQLTKTFLWCILEADRKAFFIFGRKRKCRRKWNSIYGRKRNENENRHSFSAEKRKRKSPDNINIFLFHTFSHQVSPTMRRQYLVQFRLFAGGPCWRDSTHVQCIFWHFSRWRFYPWTVCFSGLLLRSESNFSYWRLCGPTNRPHC